MSYILDALRKSETERRQGKIPDLGHQVQLIHQPRKKRSSAVVWIALALGVNAAVLTVLFWPQFAPMSADAGSGASTAQSVDDTVTINTVAAESVAAEQDPFAESGAETALAETGGNAGDMPELERERPTIIVPSAQRDRGESVLPEAELAGRVPHLVELPLSFQKSVPDLTFNSHIFSSDPFASRVMINNSYLRRGDSFSGLTVESITEDGVILSKHGQRFRVGIVRDWVSPR